MSTVVAEILRQGRRGRFAAPLLMGFLLVGLVAFTAYAASDLTTATGLGRLFAGPFYQALLAAAAGLCLLRAATVRADRAAWFSIGLAGICWTGGEVNWWLTVRGLDPAPFPTAADVLWTAFYPCMYLGIGLLVSSRIRNHRGAVWLDGLIGFLCVAAFGAALFIPSLIHGASDVEAGAVVTTVIYPLGDIVLFAFATGALALSGWRPGRGWMLVIGGLTVLAVADVVTLWQIANGDFARGSLLDLLRPAALAMLGFAAWQPEERRESVALEGLRLLAAPAVFGVVAIGLLAYGNVRDLGGEGAILATAALVGVIARMTIAFRENMSLTAGLRNANERAATDPLTGLPNHRTFHERLNAEVERARRYGRELSLVVLDLDNFKNVNDVHGHQLGDAVLREIGLRLSRHVRAGDTLGRIGGEEFGWILPDADGLDAWDAAERARLAIAEEPIPGVGAVTVSAGICDLAYGKTAADMFRLADGALYWAKLDGRNAAHRYTPEVVSALSAEERAQLLEHSQALGAIRVLARAVDAKDATTQRHSERVAELAGLIAEVLGWPASRVELLREAGLVHDVGKIGVPDAILRKPGWLTDEEYELIKGHAALSAQMVSEVLSAEQVAWVRGHHERWDGRGYPDALAGEEIPLGARVLAAADAWDAMTASRPYREALSAREALAELERGVSTQWCPAVAGALMAMLEVDLVPASEARERALAVG